MDTIGDEACALKVARALSYINFSSLERWFGHPGFIKIFQGLKGEGTDLGWAILLGAIECAACGDRHLPKQVIYRILRENRVTAQHLQELFGDSSPVRPHAGGLMVESIDIVPQDAAPEMNAALKSFGEGRLAMNELGDELYRLHTGEMKDTLYYHALLTARSVRHPISAHMLWKALRLLPTGALRDEAVASALTRLEELQGEHLSSAMRWDGGAQPLVQSRPQAAPAAPPNPLGDGQSSPPPVGDYRERAARMLQAANIPQMRHRSSRMTALTGYDAGRIKELTEPFLLRAYSDGDDSLAERMLILAVGPPEVDKPAILHGVARELGLRFMLAPYSDFRSFWTGELESELLRLLDRARLPVPGGQCRPVMLVLSENGPQDGAMPRLGRSAPSPQEVARALGGLLSGPRRREAAGEAGSTPVILVATISGATGIESSLRDESFVIHLEPPGAAQLERLLILNVVGRYWVCDLDGISFPKLGEEAVGLTSQEISRVAQRAKLRALARRARQLGAGLVNAPERLRAEISRSYMITQEDLSSVIKAEKLWRSRAHSFQDCGHAATGSPPSQTDILRWEQGTRED